MTEINKRIRELRPSLWKAAPLTAWIMLGYGVVNLLFALGLFFYVNPSPNAILAIVNSTITFQVWSVVFTILGIFQLISLMRNDWNRMKQSLMSGVVIKSIWAIALFFRFLDGGGVLLLIIWLFLVYIQVATYINFIPNVKQKK